MQSFYKQPNEFKAFSVDFSPVLATGETLVLGNITVTVVQRDDDTNVTAAIFDTGSIVEASNVVSFRVKAGTHGKVYKITVNTGLTSGGNKHEEDIVLLVSTDVELLYTVDELKNILGITTNEKDGVLFSILKGASDYISKTISRNVNLNDYTQTLYLDEPSQCVVVREFPVVSVSGITVDGVALDETLGGVKQWVVDYQTGEVTRLDGVRFPSAPIPVVVSYKAGYLSVPEDLRMAVRKIAVMEYSRRAKEGVLAETIGNYRIVFNRDEFSEAGMINKVLARYMRRTF